MADGPLSAFFAVFFPSTHSSVPNIEYPKHFEASSSRTAASMVNEPRARRGSFHRCLCFLLVLSLSYPSCEAFLGKSHVSSRTATPFPYAKFSPVEKIHTRLHSGAHDGPIARAIQKFRDRPGTHLMIPLIAAFVGWFTNWLAVQMIFYPIEFRGIPIYRRQEVPLGLLGWQGIIPCKTRPMTQAMVHMVTSQLLSVKEAFARLDPNQVANLLAPEVPELTKSVLKDVAPGWLTGYPSMILSGFGGISQGAFQHLNVQFLKQLTVSIQANIDTIFNLQNCVVNQMLQDRSKLGILFRKCGQKELDFLTNSGLWFGFLLGLVQMVVALFWDNPWSLSIGGGIVGLATNWLALKWIFQPVDPISLGPFGTLQGMFLRRQKEVAQEFSSYFANNVLNAEQLWKSVLTDPETKPAFAALFRDHVAGFLSKLTFGTMLGLKPETITSWSNAAIEKLPQHVPVTYSYMDDQLGLKDTLRVRMEKMTSRQFERVLHPIFEEDELTLILAGAALGFLAGLIQQGLETGAIKFPSRRRIWVWFRFRIRRPFRRFRNRFAN